MNDEVVFQLLVFAVIEQVNPGIDVLEFDLGIIGHVSFPPGRILPRK